MPTSRYLGTAVLVVSCSEYMELQVERSVLVQRDVCGAVSTDEQVYRMYGIVKYETMKL